MIFKATDSRTGRQKFASFHGWTAFVSEAVSRS